MYFARRRIWKRTVKELINLRHLTIDSADDLKSVTPFLKTILSLPYRSLSILSISISWEHLDKCDTLFSLHYPIVLEALNLALLLGQATSLKSFSFSCQGIPDFADFFTYLADPALLLSLVMELDLRQMGSANWQALNLLLKSRGASLESIAIRAFEGSDAQEEIMSQWYRDYFARFDFPWLHTLEFGVAINRRQYWDSIQRMSGELHSPRFPLSSWIPSLTTLFLWNDLDVNFPQNAGKIL
ncbi:hypothetical protein C8J56DRAFT_894851 [Mycena floridula]|nr:hypothetical protein C8J56DRAFT_894851 [Mycena floridula]